MSVVIDFCPEHRYYRLASEKSIYADSLFPGRLRRKHHVDCILGTFQASAIGD